MYKDVNKYAEMLFCSSLDSSFVIRVLGWDNLGLAHFPKRVLIQKTLGPASLCPENFQNDDIHFPPS